MYGELTDNLSFAEICDELLDRPRIYGIDGIFVDDATLGEVIILMNQLLEQNELRRKGD